MMARAGVEFETLVSEPNVLRLERNETANLSLKIASIKAVSLNVFYYFFFYLLKK